MAYRGIKCLNCAHPLDISDKFCPNCSQANTTKKLSFSDFFSEFFASIISYDSKLRKTLSSLVFRPGKISKDYIQGKRLTYTNPFRFLLSLAFIYFIMISFSSDFSGLNRMNMDENNNVNFTDNNYIKWEGITDEERLYSNLIIDSIITLNRKKKDSILSSNPKSYFDSISKKKFLSRFFDKVDFFQSGISSHKFFTYEEALKFIGIKPSRENKNSFAMANSIIKIKNQPGTFISYLISKIPFIIFFFLPIFAVFIWLIYDKKRFTYMDHLIFGFHNQSMLMLLMITSLVLEIVFNKFDFLFITICIFLFYLYKAMRKFYEEKRFKTIMKFLFLNFTFFVLAFTVMLMYIFGIAFTY